METIRKGIIAGFSGKIGTIVYRSKKVISHMRSLPLSVKKANAKAQTSQRTKFAIALKMLIPMTAFLRTDWKIYAHMQSKVLIKTPIASEPFFKYKYEKDSEWLLIEF